MSPARCPDRRFVRPVRRLHRIVPITFALELAPACATRQPPSPERVAIPALETTAVAEPSRAIESPAPDPEPLRPVEPQVPRASPSAERWVANDAGGEPYGYVCVYWAGGHPRCREGILESVARWRSRSNEMHSGDPARADHVLLLRRRAASGAGASSATVPAERPIEGSDLTVRELASDGRHFVFIEVGGWLLEAESCARHVHGVRSDLIELAKRIDAELFEPSDGGP